MKIVALPPDGPDSDALYKALNTFSAEHGHNTRKRENTTYLFVLRDDQGKFLGGIQGGIYGGWLDIYTLYSTREIKGVGTRLMDHVENYARENNCKGVKLVTYEFQAPEFYRKRGYEIYGELEDLVENYTNIYMKKVL